MLSNLSNYSFPIVTAISIFPLVFCLISIPFLVWNYRKYNGLSVMRATVIFSFVFYMMCAFFLTLLPLPTIQEVLDRKPATFNNHLFNNIISTMSAAGFVSSDSSTWFIGANWKKLLTSAMLFQIIANIIMQVPLGFYLRYYFRVSWKRALWIGFLISMFYEMTQLSGVWGIYPYAFRCPDVDDLMNNTLGCMIGFAAAPILMRFLPSVEEMDMIAAKRGERMEIIRAFTAFAVDWFVCNLINFFVNYVAYHYFAGFIHSEFLQVELLKIILLAGYFIVLPKLWEKQTIGNALVKVKIVSDNKNQSEVTAKNLLYRNIILYFAEPMVAIISIILIVSTASCYTGVDSTNFQRTVLTSACIIFFPIVFIVLMNSIARKGGLPHNTWTNTHLELDN
ncbi:VanZ family protein [Butyrivibrio sp. YAB3001]|uniref:VanZ family protein n=1 Tax=Butyrivibrio sp. YAB3001 TaxID=1520812 RepID=UPI0008F666C2|nr:VanZ family protein [Butyrivibrio sp. YAB3001]SFB83211.1 Glycopeptide antibiotics resistance protein [Butyrivibrio sp. YAB3001]